jgi:AcrR family transcriptional regulator
MDTCSHQGELTPAQLNFAQSKPPSKELPHSRTRTRGKLARKVAERRRITPSANTADRFLNAAEQLFAEHGYRGTSVRSIASKAKVNLGALHYYWGSKWELYRAVVTRRLRPMNEERLRRFSEIEQAADGTIPDLRAVLTAFVAPAIHMDTYDPAVAEITRALYHRMNEDPATENRDLTEEVYGEVSRRFIALLRRCCTHLPADEFFWRVQTAYGVVRFSRAGSPWLARISGGEFRGDDLDQGIRYIVQALHAGLTAPAVKSNP